MLKELVRPSDTPKKLHKIQFGVFGEHDVFKFSEVEVVNRVLYGVSNRVPVEFGCLDPRMGTSDKQSMCKTCGKKLQDCVGHFGHIKLELPVFHVGFFKAIVQILQNVCKSCCTILLSEKERLQFLNQMRRPGLDDLQKKVLLKRLNDRCRKYTYCFKCGEKNGPVKKVATLKIVHEKNPPKKLDPTSEEFLGRFDTAIDHNPEVKNYLSKAQEDLNPLKVNSIFERITPEDCEVLGLDPINGRPENLIWKYLPVPPACIRPSVSMEGGAGSNEDDLTVKLTEIIHTNSVIKTAIEKGNKISVIIEDWEFLQFQVALYINSEMPGIPPNYQNQKAVRGFCQRLKGKTGRFRGNLSGKRVDFSGRTVISPDPNLKINEVAVPVHVAEILTYPERVIPENIQRLRKLVLNGPKYPGANYVSVQHQDRKLFLKFANREKVARELKVGDCVERHLTDGDIVLFNRQPSLHKLSIMSHFAKVRPFRTFRLNECACGPYNADFDGDEMNLHLPQTEEARTEAMMLMGVKDNLITPRNGEPVIAATQDFITACHLLSKKDVFYNKRDFTLICNYMSDANLHIDIPPPAIVKPVELWTGKQLFTVLMRPNKKSKVLVNLETKTKSYTEGKDMCPKDGWLVIRNSEIMCGSLDKSNVGSGSKTTIFHVILRDFGAQESVDCMSRLAKLCARWIGNEGFSIGIDDVRPGSRLSVKKDQLVEAGYARCDEFIQQYHKGELQLSPGCNAEETLESKITGELSKIRDDAGQICLNELHKYNSPLIMAISGSKGSKINISQMVACVGQQVVNGTRIPEGFVERTLPHFPIGAKTPAAKGFVKNSFFTGLTPTEFFFHTMGGREGLVDTAVKTAETGYMARRLMKALEDLSVQYDTSVRSSTGNLVQFIYGDDGLDPASMEGADKPVDFPHLLSRCQWIKGPANDRTLLPYEIKKLVDERLASKDFSKCTELFLDDIRSFFDALVKNLGATRARFGLPPALEHKEVENVSPGTLLVKPLDQIYRLTRAQLNHFLEICLTKYLRAFIEPGTACGAIGAQSISEPGTQMTLKTFHFAGVASMNVTLGVPRIKEIINASKIISTPIITASLSNKGDLRSAKVVKGRIEKIYLETIIKYIQEVYRPSESFLLVKLDTEYIQTAMLEIDVEMVRQGLLKAKGLKLKPKNIAITGDDQLRVYPVESEKTTNYFSMQSLKLAIPKVAVSGIMSVVRAVVNVEDKVAKTYNLLVEGTGLLNVMTTIGIDGRNTSSNHVMETATVLGIEAARTTIINEIQYTMGNHGMSIDIRHVKLLADLMTCMGEVLGITRYGISKMKDSVLMLASFERTTDHLFDAAVYSKSDSVDGVSECIIMGTPMPVGTGLFKVLQKHNREQEKREVVKRALLFDRPEFHPRLT